MSLKRLIIASVVWLAVTIGLGLLGVWYIAEHPVRGASSEERAARLGTGAALFASIGLAALWLPFAAKIGRRRREERERQRLAKSKPRRRP